MERAAARSGPSTRTLEKGRNLSLPMGALGSDLADDFFFIEVKV